MRLILVLIVGIALGIAAVWYFQHGRSHSKFRSAGEEIKSTAKSAGAAFQDKLRSWHLDSDDISNELSKTGRVIREKAQSAGQKISDATADARATTEIKAKLVRDSGLAGLDIHVSTTDGVVTLSGAVSNPEQIGKAMMLAMETDGVKQVVSTMQLKPKG